jgi:hypothetical protein
MANVSLVGASLTCLLNKVNRVFKTKCLIACTRNFVPSKFIEMKANTNSEKMVLVTGETVSVYPYQHFVEIGTCPARSPFFFTIVK